MPRKNLAPVVLSMYTIYRAAERFAVRRSDILPGHPSTVQVELEGDYQTLEKARASLPPWLWNTGRAKDDDESVVETWL